MACVALGFGHPSIGLAYGAGFVGSLLASCAWPGSGDLQPRDRRDPRQRDSLQVIEALRSFSRPAWTASFVVGGGLLLLLAARVLVLE